jgi:hypothetical protein
VPAPDDLVELRSLVQGTGIERSRVESVLNDHAEWFRPLERFSSREHHILSRESLLDLLHSTYRGARTSASPHVAQLATMDVTVASDCVVFQRRT